MGTGGASLSPLQRRPVQACLSNTARRAPAGEMLFEMHRLLAQLSSLQSLWMATTPAVRFAHTTLPEGTPQRAGCACGAGERHQPP